MTLTRRALITQALTASAASVAAHAAPSATAAPAQLPSESMAAGAGAPAGIEADLPAAERLLGLAYTPKQRKQLARGYRAVLKELAGIRARNLPNHVSPAVRFDPRIPGKSYRMPAPGVRGTSPAAGALPTSPVDVALAPAWKQAAWLRGKRISSVELTHLYLDRIGRLSPALQNFITVTDDLALKQAASADADLAGGRMRSGLHGVPYGLKDLFDVAHVRTTWGAEPYRERVAASNAAIVDKLEAAGTVLLGKTSAGALAYGDIWFGGTTRNPWNPAEGSSGSSAGSASATAAGLAGFSIGTETLGSIVSPSNRCGTTGLRPTFGRVSRHGAMALAWSWDKVGPIARSVTDCALTLDIINGPDSRDWGSLDASLGWDWQASARGLRVGYHGASHRVPRAICLWSALFREDVLITLGRALEAVLGVADQNPPLALS